MNFNSKNKFYQLSANEVVQLSDLSPTERQLYLYLRSLDPFCDGLEIAVREVAKILGKARETISRALSKLEKGGWLPMKIVRRCVYHCFSPKQTASSSNARSETSKEMSHSNAKKQTQKESQPLQTATPDKQNYSELEQLNQKLEESFADQREIDKFVRFCKRKMDKLQYPVQLPKKWILSNWEFLYSEFREVYPNNESAAGEQHNNSECSIRKDNIDQDSVATNEAQQLQKPTRSQRQYRPAKEVSPSSPEYFQIIRQRIEQGYVPGTSHYASNSDRNDYHNPSPDDGGMDDCGIDDASNDLHPADQCLSEDQRQWLRSMGSNV